MIAGLTGLRRGFCAAGVSWVKAGKSRLKISKRIGKGGDCPVKKLRTILCLALCAALCCVGAPALAQAEPMVINIGRGGDTTTMDPIYAGDNVDIWMMSLVFEGLVRSSDDGKSIEPCLATDWTVSDDGLTYTFHLRDGVKFSHRRPRHGGRLGVQSEPRRFPRGRRLAGHGDQHQGRQGRG